MNKIGEKMSSVNNTTMRLTGLASTLDTEAIVDDLMKASRIKVDKVEQQKTVLEWKKEFYQEITNKLYEFQKKYFNNSSWMDEFSKPSAIYNSSYISVTPSQSSSAGNIYIDDIVSLASSAKLVSSQPVSSNPTIEINTDSLSELAGKSIVVNLNGIEKMLTFSNRTYSTSADVQAELCSQLDDSFGSGLVNVSLNGDVMSLSAPNSSLTIKTPTDGTAPTNVLTFENLDSNRIDMNASLDSAGLKSPLGDTDISFEINGKSFSFTSSSTLKDIMNTVNSSDAGVKMSYSTLTDTFTMTSTATGSASDVSVSDTNGNLMNSLFGAGIKTNGTDAVVKLSPDGSETNIITVTRSTNSIDINGTNLTLIGKAAGNTQEAINISLNHDKEAVTEKIRSFIKDYNELLSSVTTKLSEEHDRNYLPLTETQKEDMSEKEIELWTEKAKSGLLRNDIYLREIESELRSCFYIPVTKLGDNTSSLGLLAEIGIATTNYSDKGSLSIDETKLANALNNDYQKVLDLFTQKSDISYSLFSPAEQQQKRFSESGMFYRLSDILSKNLSKVGKKGALINLVGSPTDKFTGDTEYSKRIKDYEDKIQRMEDKLVDEENRYWDRFTAMENALAHLNQQSAWLANMMGNNE